MKQIDIHADDYAVSRHASADLITCLEEGKIDSISVIPNMSCFTDCITMLQEKWESFSRKPEISVHINFMEGHCVSDAENVPDLVDASGYFTCSWGSLLLASYNPISYNRMKRQLQTEIKVQIEKVQAVLPKDCELRLDSHQHTHMIPIVFDAMTAVIEENRYPVTFIRVAREPLLPFLKQPSLYAGYSKVNVIKNVILNFYAGKVDRKLRAMGIEQTLLCGLIMSGEMDFERMKKIYPSMICYCEKKGKKIEILFHPGCVLPEEINAEYVKEGFVEFHLSEGRKKERYAVEHLMEVEVHE